MNLRRLALLTTFAALAAMASIGTSSAAAAPVLNLDIHHHETNFSPGGVAEYWFDVVNVGDTATSGPISLTVNLPNGLSRAEVRQNTNDTPFGALKWSCPGSPGDPVVECTATGSLSRHSSYRALVVAVDVEPEASGDRFATATLEGGGSVVPVSAVEPTHISPAPAGFGIVPSSFVPDFFKADGITPVREAGAHPDLFVTAFDFNTIPAPFGAAPEQKVADERIHNLVVDTPPGFIGNPTAVGECTPAQLTIGACPASSQVGRIDLRLYPITSIQKRQTFSPFTNGVFNMTHPRGTITDLGFTVLENPIHIKISLDPSKNYAIRSEVPNVNETVAAFDQRLTLWGVPADPSHDSERCQSFKSQNLGAGSTNEECSTDHERLPFLSVPSECGVEHVMRLHSYDSWQHKGVFGPEIDYSQPGETTNCDKPRFEPDVEINPTGKQANTPTGLDVHVKVAHNENPNALATPPVKRFTVTLPKGMSFSPSFADGLQSCSLGQIKLGTNEPVTCPDASRIGEVELHTPLLPRSAEGSMYLASQGDNPFGSLFALYLVLHDTEERGALIKIPGKIELDPVSGQITTIFNDTPQLPFDDLTLKFRSGPRAPLVNSPSCGVQRIGVQIASYAQPNNPVDVSNTYDVTEGPNGTPCPPDSARRPFQPRMEGGTLNPSAGAYSPFVFRLSREDSEQELSQVTTVLPPGLVARIAGIPPCSDAAIASISTAEGAGAGEAASSACPAASQIGSISAGLGAGPGPNYFPGKVFLAGPYKGAPLSLVIIAPGLAGPFDLGNVIVRAAIRVDRSTAQVTAVSDPFPTILHGVILRVRDVRLRVDRPNTTINPTSCDPMAVNARVTGVGGDLLSTADDSLFAASNPFQVASCASLGFKPNLSLQLFGGTKRGSHPKLRATLTYPKVGNYANIAAASVALPHSEFLDQNHIKTICTRVQFAAEQCPAGSVYGSAVAKTPLFGSPLSGPVYLRSSNNPLPDMVAVLKGPASQPIEIDLSGRIDSVNGGIRNTFDVVPDTPVESFTLELLGGKKGLLVNSRNLCNSVNKATAKFIGQNGATFNSRPVLQNSCKKARKKKGAAAKNRKAASRSVVAWLLGTF